MITQQFLLWGVGISHVPPPAVMCMTNCILLWWSLDSVLLPLVLKPKVVKGNSAMERRVQVQSYVNQIELTSELGLQCNYFAHVEQHFHLKN